MFSMVFFNTILTGRFNSSDLAGVAIGSSIWNPIFTGISAILLAVSPIAAQRFGQKKGNEVATVVSSGIYVSFIIGFVVILAGVAFLNPLLTMMNLPENVHQTAHDYLVGLSFGIIPLFVFNVLRSFIYALGITRVVMFILLVSVPINLLLNYVLIFGAWGFPSFGGGGAGLATSITYWIIVGITAFIIMTKEPFTSYKVFVGLRGFTIKESKELLKIGIPMGLSTFFETSMFAVVTILISKFSVTTVAAYQSALNIVSFLYMYPVGCSMALGVLIGSEGRGERYLDAKIYSLLGIALSMLIALVTGLLVILFRFEVAGLYSTETAVITLTAQFLIYALFFQVSDA